MAAISEFQKNTVISADTKHTAREKCHTGRSKNQKRDEEDSGIFYVVIKLGHVFKT
jgi:hypothetical protein